MRQVGLLGSARCRSALLAGAAALALLPAAARAQEPESTKVPNPAQDMGLQGLDASADVVGLSGLQEQPTVPPPGPLRRDTRPAQASPPGADGLGPDDVYLESNLLIDDPGSHTVTARGAVEARYQGRTLRADEVVYDTMSGRVNARGHAMMINADGSVEYGDTVELDDKFKAGVVTAFAARLPQNVTLVAGAGIRRSENVNELKSAIYTACNICNADGTAKQPTWSVQATTVIQDREHQVIYYHNAVVRIKGVPVLYTPIFWHPDPSADRRSGFLAPKLRYANRLGLSYEQPYLWSISPYADLVISPMFTSEVNPFLNLEYRQRFYSGILHARVGYTYDKLFDARGRYGDRTSRSYILADGVFQISDAWRWGFGAERVSDPTLFARYHIENIYRQRGPFTTDTQRLISQLFTERQDTTSFLSISALSFQSLRVQQLPGRQLVSYDSPTAFPFVAPLIEARIDPDRPVLGGRFRFLGSAVVLTRNQDVNRITPQGIAQNQTIDDRRATAQADWRSSLTFSNGMRVEPFAQARVDGYSVDDPLKKTGRNATVARALTTVGADLTYPFIKVAGNTSIILEPIVQLAASPDYHVDPRIPNEDSVALEFDSTNLFSTDRFPGFDLYEGGLRSNVGGRATVNWGAGHSAQVLVGRSFRTRSDPNFYAGSGLEGTSSDWVTAVTLSPITGLSMFSRSRLASDNLRLRREEAGLDASVWRVTGSVRYLYSERDISGAKTESLSIGGTFRASKHFGASVVAVRDLNAKLWPLTQYSVYYQDECLRVDVIFTHDQTYASTIVPANAVQVRLTLATLGGQGR